jgi:hypothetical protein
MLIDRYLKSVIHKTLDSGFITVLYGARQTGKTTLARSILADNGQGIYLNCDEPDIRERLTNKSSTELFASFGTSNLVVIDEAQRVKNIGLTAKLIHDTFPEIKLLLTGSSSIDLANTVKEPLTGRSVEHILYPLALTEVADDIFRAERLVEKSLIFGNYPKSWLLDNSGSADYLRNLANNYLYRDAFAIKTIFDTTIIDRLLRLLAFQIGSEVSYSEIARHIEVSKETAMRYIDLLEKAFIVFRLNQYRKNQRNEVGRLRKVYFYDLGIRNGLIDNFQPLSFRNDVEALWENYCMVERRKYLQKMNIYARHYFWRSYTRQEIDLIEEIGTTTSAYEFKYKYRNVRVPTSFHTEFPSIPFTLIHKESMNDFLI